ncbi:MAG: hypothetical protein DCF31_07745 [Alphaproteobacteria bacterium]|nr:MAG: hypothetical protein DCF31_07745 [Alphaproteobacteria bacterium]
MTRLLDLDKLVSRAGAFSLTVSLISYSFSAGKISVFGPRLQSFFSFPDLAFNFSALTRATITVLSVVLVIQVAAWFGEHLVRHNDGLPGQIQRLLAMVFSLKGTILFSIPLTLAIYFGWRPFIDNEYDNEYRIMFHILLPLFGLATWFSLGRYLHGSADGYVVITTMIPAILIFAFFVGRFESIAQVSCYEFDDRADRRYFVDSYVNGRWKPDGEGYKIIVASSSRALLFRRLPSRDAYIRLWDYSQDRSLMRYMIKDGALNSLPCRATS